MANLETEGSFLESNNAPVLLTQAMTAPNAKIDTFGWKVLIACQTGERIWVKRGVFALVVDHLYFPIVPFVRLSGQKFCKTCPFDPVILVN